MNAGRAREAQAVGARGQGFAAAVLRAVAHVQRAARQAGDDGAFEHTVWIPHQIVSLGTKDADDGQQAAPGGRALRPPLHLLQWQREYPPHGGMQSGDVGEARIHRPVDEDAGPACSDVGYRRQGLHLIAHGRDLHQQDAARRRWQAMFTPTQGQ
ncbi:hypothetical protein GALL_433070 [mine drainage metagenome]|uniref:Uncharacterized protein n=1 Tax=mine drainage metagenome TaxID=410659 RepID=A0A1J5PTT4_9ZZZZ